MKRCFPALLCAITLSIVPVLAQQHPPVTPAWFLGHVAWEDNRNTQASTLELVRQYLDHDIPVDGVIVDSPWSTSYNDFIWDGQRYPDPAAMASALNGWGVKPILWLTGNVNLTSNGMPQDKCDDYDEAIRAGYAINDGKPSKWWKGTGLQIDFTNPQAREWFYKRLDRAFTDGFYGLKVDQGEVYFGDPVKTSLGEMSNEQFRPYYYDAMYDYVTSRKPGLGAIVGRPYSHQRGRHAGIGKLSLGWCGDFGGDWKGLKLQIDNIYRSAQMGYGAVGTEVAGFMGARSDRQQFIRYVQFAALTACMINGGENGGWTNHLPWWHGEDVADIYRYCVTLHRELVPYLFSGIVDTHLNGGSLMPQTSLEEESHMLGNDLFTKAITSEENTVTFTLPTEGSWIDFFTGLRYDGGRVVTRTFADTEFPLYVRTGAILPMRIENEVTGLGDAALAGKRVFVIYPDGKSSRRFHLPVGEGTDYFDCQVSCDARHRRITLTSDQASDWVFIIKGKRTKRVAATGTSLRLKY